MMRLRLEALGMLCFFLYLAVSCVQSFNVSEQQRADDISINRYKD